MNYYNLVTFQGQIHSLRSVKLFNKYLFPDPKPDADDSKWSKEAEDKITQIQKSGVENHDENETDKKLKEDLSSSLAKTKHKSELKKNPTEHSANHSAKEATISESGQVSS